MLYSTPLLSCSAKWASVLLSCAIKSPSFCSVTLESISKTTHVPWHSLIKNAGGSRCRNEHNANCARRKSLRCERVASREAPTFAKRSPGPSARRKSFGRLINYGAIIASRSQKAARTRSRPTPEKIVSSLSWSPPGFARRSGETRPNEQDEAEVIARRPRLHENNIVKVKAGSGFIPRKRFDVRVADETYEDIKEH